MISLCIMNNTENNFLGFVFILDEKAKKSDLILRITLN